jgi:hypothetical protein
MSDTPLRRVLYLTTPGFTSTRLGELQSASSLPGVITETFALTESNAPEALGKIFAADTIAVWSALIEPNPKSD